MASILKILSLVIQQMNRYVIIEIKPIKGGSTRLNIPPRPALSIFAVMESIQVTIVENSRINIPSLLMLILYCAAPNVSGISVVAEFHNPSAKIYYDVE